jgi:hypothetical protein
MRQLGFTPAYGPKEIIEEISLIPEWKELMVKLNAE